MVHLRNWFRRKPEEKPEEKPVAKQVLSITTDRPTLELTLPDGTTTRWQYDVVVLKLKMQMIQDASGRSIPDQADLQKFCDCLILLGMPDCNVDVALRIWSLVLVQFQQVALSIARQVEQCRSS